jgi:hypothetical protein
VLCRARAVFNKEIASANAKHQSITSESVMRRDAQLQQCDSAVLMKTDRLIVRVEAQLEETQRISNLMPNRPMEHYCTITTDSESSHLARKVRSLGSLMAALYSLAAVLRGAVMADPVMTLCGHTFDRLAVEKWLTAHNTCPLCSSKVDNQLIPNIAVRNIIEDWGTNMRRVSSE